MTLALASRRAALLPGRWVSNELWRRARAVPSLDLRFAESKSLIDAVSGQQLITFSRVGSGGTFVNSAGQIETAAENVPRFDHNPVTLESLGLLVEEQRTNSVRNNTMVGAVAGTPGTLPTNWPFQAAGNGIAVSVVGTGTDAGITYLDWRVSGTATANATATVSFDRGSAATGQTWTTSAYLKLAAGNLTGASNPTLSLIEETSGASFVTGALYSIPLPTAASLISQRSSATRTLSGGATVALVRTNLSIDVANGSTVDFTLRIGLPQLEQGAFATSVIPTSGTAVTRSASLADIVDQAIANNIRTLCLEFRSPASGTRGVVSLNDNTANERAAVITSGTDPRLVVHDGGVEQANIDGGTVTANTRTRVAVRINANDFSISVNGGAVVTDTSGTLPTVDRLMLGRTQAGEYLNGPLARVTGWTQLVPDSTLQELAR